MKIESENITSGYTDYTNSTLDLPHVKSETQAADEDIAVSLTLSADAVTAASVSASTTDYKTIQTRLSTLGFYNGPIDGNISSSLSQRAIANFQWVYGLTRTAAMDSNTTQKLSTVISHYNQAISNMDKLTEEIGWTSSTQKINIARIWVFLKDGLGLTSVQAAGFMGNIYQESSFHPEIENAKGNYGLVQWDASRQEGLEKLVSQMELTKEDINAQFAWIREELNGDFKSCYTALKAATTITEATTILFNQYEKAQDSTLSERITKAQAIYNALA